MVNAGSLIILVLSTELRMWIGHRKEIRKLTFRALALRRSLSPSLRRRANARDVRFRISLRWPIYIINPVDKTKIILLYFPPTQHHRLFRNLPLYSFAGSLSHIAMGQPSWYIPRSGGGFSIDILILDHIKPATHLRIATTIIIKSHIKHVHNTALVKLCREVLRWQNIRSPQTVRYTVYMRS